MPTDTEKLAKHAETCLHLQTAILSPAYYYHSLPLCVIDSIFSLGVKYKQVENVVQYVCASTSWPLFRQHNTLFLLENQQIKVSALVEEIRKHQDPRQTLFNNRGYANPKKPQGERTSKADLVKRFAEVLLKNEVETFQMLAHSDMEALGEELRNLPALRSGIAVRYFQMLAGDDTQVKPDRMIQRFISDAIGKQVGIADAVNLVQGACELLKVKYTLLTPRLLDHEIWKFQRTR